MAEKALPIGVQDFSKLIEDGYLYVDKTEFYHRLINNGTYYFLSRPRRFGKSLLLSALGEILSGNRAPFAGLWIEDKIDWQPGPVIHLDFSKIVKLSENLETAIGIELDAIAASYSILLGSGTNALKFRTLIEQLGAGTRVSVLIDEYDKPIIDHIDDLPRAEANRQVIRDLYSVVKGSDGFIRFFFVTGVSKFTQVSIFSDLNNLNDITLDPAYSQMLGYTEEELKTYFAAYIEPIEKRYEGIYPDIYQAIKEWYNGYSWDGEHFVYNPFSILKFLSQRRFADFWFSTGTPSFLMKLLKAREYPIHDLSSRKLDINLFDKFDIQNIEVNSLLFQSGYLTMKELDLATNVVTLDFPNREVENSFNVHLLSEFGEVPKETANSLLNQMTERLLDGDIDGTMELMGILFANVVAPLHPRGSKIERQENYYHSIFYMCLKLLGFHIQSEIWTNRGRIDAVLTTEKFIYVIEFKLGSAEEAIAQIKKMGYAQRYKAEGKTMILLGIGFDAEARNIGGYLAERLN
ncbi:MAG: ATP-binding protein [Bacteroidia bacterium]